MINVITETRRRLEYLRKELDELKNFDKTAKLVGKAKDHIHDEISKTEINIEYYLLILKMLEDK